MGLSDASLEILITPIPQPFLPSFLPYVRSLRTTFPFVRLIFARIGRKKNEGVEIGTVRDVSVSNVKCVTNWRSGRIGFWKNMASTKRTIYVKV